MTATIQTVSNPFDQLDLIELRRRSSAKWQYYPGRCLAALGR